MIKHTRIQTQVSASLLIHGPAVVHCSASLLLESAHGISIAVCAQPGSHNVYSVKPTKCPKSATATEAMAAEAVAAEEL